jgi:hypothetical protein
MNKLNPHTRIKIPSIDPRIISPVQVRLATTKSLQEREQQIGTRPRYRFSE